MHAWDKSEGGGKIRIWRILNLATLLLAALAFFLALKKPAPVAQPQPQAAISANAQSFQAKVDQLEQTQPQGATVGEVRLTGDEVGAALAQAMGSAATAQLQPASTSGSSDVSTPIAPGNVEISSIGEPIVSFQGDKVIGQFATDVAGKKVYITVAGRLGAKGGYVTFDPSEFKFGDLNVPISLVNEALQKKMMEQRDRLKLPEFISDLRVENGELVITKK